MKKTLPYLLIVTTFALSGVIFHFAKASQTSSPTRSIHHSEVTSKVNFTEMNRRRVEQGLPALVESELTCKLSEYRVAELAKLGELDDHRGRRSKGYNDLFQLLVDKRGRGIATSENLARVDTISMSPQEVINVWEASTEGHKEAMYNQNYTEGCLRDAGWNNDHNIFVLTFGEVVK